MTNLMKNYEIEKRLTYLQDTDPTNPEIYELLVQLTGNLIISQKWNMSPADFDCVTHDVAADMFLKVSQGYGIRVWKAFCYRLIKFCYVPKQRKITRHQVFDTRFDPLVREAIVSTFVSSGQSFSREVRVVENKTMLSNLHNVIEEVLDNSKFANRKSDRIALDISISLSLMHKKLVYFHLSDAVKPMLNMYVTQVRERIMSDLHIMDNEDLDVAYSSLYSSELYAPPEEE